MERVTAIDEIQHPIIREALRSVNIEPRFLEITSMSDIPAGTGLGSSGSFTTALLHALYTLKQKVATKHELAEHACHIEIDRLGEPIGKQDQYIAAFGGLLCLHFHPDGHVEVEPLRLDSETLLNLEDNLLLFFTGYSRAASSILKEQDSRSRQQDQAMTDHLHLVKDMGIQSRKALERGNLREFAAIMHEHWLHKQKRSASMSNDTINESYALARANGALGGKLIGAGGGGFLMLYSEEKTRLRAVMRQTGLREVRLRFDLQGTGLVAHS
jgi:D-glycero-alpha-D-manno-heptose-7-phosphate kinase